MNPITNKIYVNNSYGGVTVIDGVSESTTNVLCPNSSGARAISLNIASNKIYLANATSDNVCVVDGVTDTATVAFDPNANAPWAIGGNPVTGKIYVGNGTGNCSCGSSNTVTVITEQQPRKIPIQVRIDPLPHDRTHNPSPTFTFAAADKFKPHATKIDRLLFQADTWQGKWQTAKNLGSGKFRGKLNRPLQLGIHILYAYATDGQEATSTVSNQQSSPLIGNVKAYVFLVY